MTSRDPLKVVHVTQALGGVSQVIENIVAHADGQSFDFSVIAPPGIHEMCSDSGKPVPVYHVSFVRSISPRADTACLFQTIAHLRRIRPHLVHAHSSKAGVIGRLAAKYLNIPVIYTPHAFSFLDRPSSPVRRLYILLEKIAKPWTTLLLACSESERRTGIEVLGFAEAKTAVWRNAIDPAALKAIGPVHCDARFICTVSRPSHQKNLQMLVSVMEILGRRGVSVACIMVGAGFYAPMTQEVHAMMKSCGLEARVFMLDWLDHQEVVNIVANSLCYVSTSRYEGLPLSILEAMGLGKAVIATDVPGNRDCVLHGRTGLLTPSEDAVAMADAVEMVVRDEELRRRMGERAREYVGEEFDITRTIGLLARFYRSVAGRDFR
jgi:glycosyltransferase involved in cell wall biosynthesis